MSEEAEYKLNDGDYCAHPECAEGVLLEVFGNTVECQACFSHFNMTTGEMLREGPENEGIAVTQDDEFDEDELDE